jgi:radical SAM superfamily enzyme YgiQ (UPF0313 family)
MVERANEGPKVLIIVPPNITYEAFLNPTRNTKTWMHSSGLELGVIITDVPLGAITISAWLKEKCQADVTVLDFNVLLHKSWNHASDVSFSNWFDQELAKLDFVPDLIGFSSLFVTGYNNLLDMSKICRRRYPASLIVAGGNLATTMYNEIFQDDDGAFDALCYGEGELPLKELFAADDKFRFLADSKCWITREKVGPSQSSLHFEHRYIENLDEIPSLDYSAIDLHDYHHSPTIKAYTQIKNKDNYITFMTSRGCPFLCTFCSAHTVHGREMRYFSLERVQDELSALTKKYGANTLVLEDDHFLSDRERALGVLKLARELGLVCVFPNALALYALDREMLEALYSTGVRQLTLAVESGSKRVLKELIKKPLRVDIIHRVANDCWDLGIYTDCNIIIGMPGETDDDIEESREFLKSIPANWFRINVATPLAGSEMYIEAHAKGQIVGDIRKAGYKDCVINTDSFTPEKINKIAYEFNIELNFVNNTDMKRGNYQRAAESFCNVLTLKHDHAFAKYYLGQALTRMGKEGEGRELIDEAVNAMHFDPLWRDFAVKFGLFTANVNEPGQSRLPAQTQ